MADDSTNGWAMTRRRDRLVGRMLEGRNMFRARSEDPTKQPKGRLASSLQSTTSFIGLTTRRNDPFRDDNEDSQVSGS